jgi:conjugal transfer/type IV secretion protein DotA/TraY
MIFQQKTRKTLDLRNALVWFLQHTGCLMSESNQSSVNKKIGARRVMSEVFATQATANMVRSTVNTQKNLFNGFRFLIGDLFKKPERIDIPETITDPTERFEYALDYTSNRGVLEKMIKNASLRTQVWLVAAIFLTALGLGALKNNGFIYELVAGPKSYVLTGILLPFLLAVPLWALFVKWSFWSFQMRHRRLNGIMAWLKMPSEWLPPDLPGGKVVNLIIAGSIGAAMMQHGINQAVAQTVSSAISSGAGVTNSSVFQSLIGSLPTGDLSFQMLSQLFPSLFSSTGVSFANDAAAQMLQALNTALIGIASVMLGYHITAGVVASAHDGEVLGKRMHTIWTPIRIGVGVAGLVPISGYCAAQIIALQIVTASCGLANLAWDSYVSAATGTNGHFLAAMIPPTAMDDDGTFNQVIDDAVCLELGRYLERSGGPNGALPSIASVSGTAMNGASGAVFADPTKPSNTTQAASSTQALQSSGVTEDNEVWNFGAACGTISFPGPVSTAQSATQSAASEKAAAAAISASGGEGAAEVQSFADTSASATDTATTNFYNARNAAFTAFITEVVNSTFVQDIVEGNAPGGSVNLSNTSTLQTSLQTLAGDWTNYESGILGSAEAYSSSENSAAFSQLSSQAQDLGWAAAGAMEPLLLAKNSEVTTTAEQTPSADQGNPDLDGPSFATNLPPIDDQLANAESGLLFGVPSLLVTTPITTGSSASSSSSSGSSSSSSGAMSKLTALSKIDGNPESFMDVTGNYMGSNFELFFLNQASITSVDPIQEISAEGYNIKLLGYSALGIYAAALGTAAVSSVGESGAKATFDSLTGGSPVLGKGPAAAVMTVLRALGAIIVPVCTGLIIIGLFLQIVVPMIGYIVWVSAVIGWLAFVCEFVVCSAMTSFSMVETSGEEMVNQKQSYGVGMMLIALFYPTLMVLGLIFASIMQSAAVSFVTGTFVFGTDNIGKIVDPLAILLLVFIQSALYYNVIIRSYRLITMFPEYASSYFGVSSNGKRDDTHNTAVGIITKSRGTAEGHAKTAIQGIQSGLTPQKPQRQRIPSGNTSSSGGGGTGEDGEHKKSPVSYGAFFEHVLPNAVWAIL